MNLEPLDVLLLLLIAVGVLSGFQQGAIAQTLGLVGAGLGAVVAVAVLPEIAVTLPAVDRLPRALLVLGILLLALAVGQAVGAAIAMVILRRMGRGPLERVDRLAGLAVGAAKVVLAIWFLAPILSAGPSPTLAQQIDRSTVVGLVRADLPSPAPVLGRVRAFLDPVGLPQVFQFLENPLGPFVATPTEASVSGLGAKVAPSVVAVVGDACGLRLSGTGFSIAPGYFVTNAHVVAGERGTTVVAETGESARARVVFNDPAIDVALLHAPALPLPALALAREDPVTGAIGVTLGHPGGGGLTVVPAAVRDVFSATGFDIYGQSAVTRVVIELAAPVQAGDSGGPFVTADDRVAGVVFARAQTSSAVGYALDIGEVVSDLGPAIGRTAAVSTGTCAP